MEEIILLSFSGALLMLDNSVAFQILLSQPLIAGPIMGLIGGDVYLGLQYGYLLQLLWLSNMPVGAARIPEGNFASMAAIILGLHLSGIFPAFQRFFILLIILYSLAMGSLGTFLTNAFRVFNGKLLERYLMWLRPDRDISPGVVVYFSLAVYFLIMFTTFLVLTILLKYAIIMLIPALPQGVNQLGEYARFAVLGSGLGLTFTLFKQRKYWFPIAIGFLLGGGILIYEYI